MIHPSNQLTVSSSLGVVYSLFLGFGISIGAELYHKMTGHLVSDRVNYDTEDNWLIRADPRCE